LLALVALLTGCGLSAFLRMRPVAMGEGLEAWLGGGGNSGLWVHGEEALLVDSKFGDYTRTLHRRAEEELGRTVRRIVFTHFHRDHTGNLAVFPEVGAVLVHPNTKARLRASPPGGMPGPADVPFVEVEDRLHLWLGGEEVIAVYAGRAHTDGDLVVLFRDRRVLFAGDVVLAGLEPEVDVEAGGDILAYRGTLDRILQLEFETVVPGHGELLRRADVERYRTYLAAVESAVRRKRGEGRSEEQTVAEVLLPEFDDLKPLPFGLASRAKTVRLMYQALERAAAAQHQG
jgi:glyoxylase-like metal-dependent hydrolase (beta-lactamase superfamily II)